MITVAITGGTGFIGSALVQAHLRRGDRVRVLTRRPGSHPHGTVAFEGDLAEPVPIGFVDGADIVYHLAAEMENPKRMHLVNVRGTQRLLHAAVGRCGRWVQLSSIGVYGPPMRGGETTELTEPRPADAYEASKLEADRAVQEACAPTGHPWAILRPSITVGASMRNPSAFALVRAIMDGRFFFIGSRAAVSTYIHVGDVVTALRLLANAPSGTVVNLSSDCAWTSLVARICERARCRMPRIRVPAALALTLARTLGSLPGFPLTASRVEALARLGGYPDLRAKTLLGFRPAYPMPAGFDEITDAVLARSDLPWRVT